MKTVIGSILMDGYDVPTRGIIVLHDDKVTVGDEHNIDLPYDADYSDEQGIRETIHAMYGRDPVWGYIEVVDPVGYKDVMFRLEYKDDL